MWERSGPCTRNTINFDWSGLTIIVQSRKGSALILNREPDEVMHFEWGEQQHEVAPALFASGSKLEATSIRRRFN
eukprot:4448458-Amphidinium_carterae.1